MRIAYSITTFLLFMASTVVAQVDASTMALKHQSIQFIQNNGQWNQKALYRTPLGTGSVFLEKNVLTYVQVDPSDLDVAHAHSGDEGEHLHNFERINGHAWRAHFIGANENPRISGFEKRVEYHNYFIGNDKSKWASNVPIYNGITYENLYENIQMKVYSTEGSFKYDFILAPNANPSLIQMDYTGLDNILIEDGNLVTQTSVGDFIEQAPFAYQIINGVQTTVPCNFVLNGTTVSFEFPLGYDNTKELVIDPVLVGATLSGGTVTNYGHCATYDNDGNIYGGARSFGVGYPTDDGSFQTTFGGGVDIAVSKYTPDATGLMFATYLGGSGQDLPHSMVVNDENELYVFGTTRSINYPVSDDAFDIVGPDGGTTEDIVVTHLNEGGTDVIGSTFVGGAGIDGINGLTSNYGDQYRGEIVVDSDGNCYIASCTRSAEFPTTPGAYQETFGGGLQDAVVFSMPPDLSTMNWSTYIGSSNDEGALGLRLDSDDNLYISGAAKNEFIAMTGYQTTYQGGLLDAFAIKLIDDGATIEYSTFWGTPSKDAAFFVDLDNDGNVFLYGQSDGGTSEVTDDVYVNPGSRQFICKLSPDLSTLVFGTVVGVGNFVPIAFMVDACGYIYFSGHSATGALSLTDDALFVTGGFYLGVLQPEAADLEFATLYSGNHVDGGTSRFDPANGVVYQAVCSCGPFTTTPGAYGTVPGGGCDLGLFKIDFGISHVNASAEASPTAEGCIPFTVDFTNESSGLTFEWDFDDGGPLSTEFEPSYIFTDPGIYNVRLVAFDPEGCLTSDTTYIEIIVGDGETPDASFEYDVNCATGEVNITYTGDPGVPVIFNMGDGATYDETDFSHIYGSDGVFTITLTAGDGFCAELAVVTEDISIGSPAVEIIMNNPTCNQFSDGSVTVDIIGPTGDEVIEITDLDGTILNVGGSNTANTLSAGWYYYHVDLGDGCETFDSVQVIDPLPLNAQINIYNNVCFGDEEGYVIVDTVYNWQGDYDDLVFIWAPDPPGISGIGADSLYNLTEGDYTLTLNDGNGCSKVFDFAIEEPPPLELVEFGMEPAYCRLYGYQSGNGVVFAAANGGTPDYHYKWTNLETGETTTNTTWGGRNPGTYEIEVTDENGCEIIRQIVVDSLSPVAQFTTTTDQIETDCYAIVPVDITFSNQSLNFANPNNPLADTTFFYNFDHPTSNWVVSHNLNETFEIEYTESGDYEVCIVALNQNGCTDTACKVITLCDPFIFDPVNIFSPDGDGINEVFTFVQRSQAVRSFYCVVVNRWGIVIAEFNSIDQGWDGTDNKGNLVPDGVYFYNYSGVGDTGATFEGQGTVQKIGK